MKIRTLSMIIVLLTVCSTAFAGERRIYVGGKKIDIHKSGRIYTDAIKSGTVTFDAEEDEDGYRRLILDNAVIETTGEDKRGINSSIRNLKIVVNGTCRITTANADGIKVDAEGSTNGNAAEICITGTGTLYVNATGGSAAYLACGYWWGGPEGSEPFFNIEGGVTVSLTSTTGNAIHGYIPRGGVYVTVKDNASLICEGKKHAINNVRGYSYLIGLSIKGGNVTLKGNGNYSTIEETSVDLGQSMEFDNPDLSYSEDKKTVLEGNSTTGYKGDIVIRKGLEITKTTFPDDKFRSYVKSLSIGEDGYLVRSELASITSMDVKNMGIKDLTGIEYFTELKSLTCFLNSLTSLDVSRNYKLESLNCAFNKLTSLTVRSAQNTKLKEVICFQNQLYVSAMSSLVYGLPTVSNGVLQIFADSGDEGNIITPAQVTAAKNKGWTVQKLNSSNQLVAYTGATGIEINETNFPDENFRTFLKSKDYGKDSFLTPDELQAVTEIDVHGKSISNLKGIEHFTALKKLWCWDNSLTSLSVSKNTQLTVLNISGNQIKGTNMTTLVNSLPSNSGEFYVCNAKYSTDNEITSAQVTTAKNKGWKVLRNNGSGYVDYNGNIDINEENFPDEQFRAFLKAQSYGSDGSLSPAELKAVTEMDVSRYGIMDMKGVEFFTSLKKLDCYHNKFSSLDVSKLTALEELLCYQNPNLTKLDVSKNTKLTKLTVWENDLTSLDVSKNTMLTNLNCRRNKLTKLDLSKNTALTTLYCDNNQIKGANMTTLVNSLPNNSGNFYVCCDAVSPDNVITTAQVKIATDKGWKVWKYTGLEASQRVSYAGDPGIEINSINFPDANFRSIVAASDIDTYQDGYLTSDEVEAVKELKLYGGKSIATLKGIEYFTELTALECGGGVLKTMDISMNTKLTSLRLEQTTMTSLDISKNTALTTLNCRNNRLASLDVSKCKSLKSLDCSGNLIRGDGMSVLVNSLPATGGTLYVKDTRFTSNYDNEITPEQVAIAKSKGWAVKKFVSPSWEDYNGYDKVVEINATNFPDEKFRAFVADPSINTNEDNGLSYEELLAVTSIDVTGLGITDLGGIENFFALKELYCACNGLTGLNVSNCKELTTLECSYNQMTILYLSDLKKLKMLICHDNNLNALYVKLCPLTYLDCSNNELKEMDLTKNVALKNLYCCSNGMTTLDVSKNTALKVLDCSGNKISGDNMTALVNSLPTGSECDFRVCDDSLFPDNVITAAQVVDATGKGWKVVNFALGDAMPYAGQGDVNSDNEIDHADLQMIEDIIMGRDTNHDEYTGDENCDGKVNAADIVTEVNILK